MKEKIIEVVRVRFALGIDYEADITADFAGALREATKLPDATSFIKRAGELHPLNDLDLAIFIISENVRQQVKGFVKARINMGGLHGRVSPVKQAVTEEPVFVEVDDVEARRTGGEGGPSEVGTEESPVASGPSSSSTAISPGVSESDGGDAD